MIQLRKTRRKVRCTASAIALTVVALAYSKTTVAQISVQPGQTATALAQRMSGQGVSVSAATLRCASVANGIFKAVNSNLGLDSGIVLTTGRAATQGSNYGVNGFTTFLASNNNGTAGDGSLTLLAGQETMDACALEFDIVPGGDTIRFDYIFSSEEYINAVCGPYNDAFAFFISGPGIAGTPNMALVPGTDIPVTINTINNGIPGTTGDIANCNSMGPGSPFTSYYISNTPGATLTHHGFTKVLQAKHSVTPCQKYHLKMVIADAGNALYDSGVFLKAGSLQASDFSISAIATTPNDTNALCVKGCLPGVFIVKRSQAEPRPATVRLVTGGSATAGIDYEPIADSAVIPANETETKVVVHGMATAPNGTKTLNLYIYPPLNCNGITAIADSAQMLIYDTVHINMLTADAMLCKQDSLQLQVSGYDFMNYEWVPATGLNNAHIKNPVVAGTISDVYTVYATLPGWSCAPKTAQVSIMLRATPGILLPADTTICYNQRLELPAVIEPASTIFSYQWSGPNGYSATTPAPTIDSMNKEEQGVYYLHAVNDTNGCSAAASIMVKVSVPETPETAPEQVFCQNSQVVALKASGTDLRWYSTTDRTDTGSTFAPYANTDQIAEYAYYVTQRKGECESPKATIKVAVKHCCDGRIFIPNAFTPNGAVGNKIFRPVIDYGYTISSMYVYNRWGQAVYTSPEGAWNGTYGGVPCDAGTYYYIIRVKCVIGGVEEKRGDVTLIR